MAHVRRPAMLIWIVVIGVRAVVSVPAHANPEQVIPISYGVNEISFGQGLHGLLVLAWRENFNAHGFDALTMYVSNPVSTGQRDAALLMVPVFDHDKEQLMLTAGGGADCQLSDFRLIRESSGAVELITAQREFGQTYVDSEPVTFRYFALKHNEGSIGRPPYYFQLTKVAKSRTTHCDVNEAFRAELGLEDYRKRE